MDASEHIASLVDACRGFYSTDLKRHNDASHPLNILAFLVDNGFAGHPGLQELNRELVANEFTVNMSISESYGGSGRSVRTWMMCDLPLTLYVSIKLNASKMAPAHLEGIETILRSMEPNGWRCTNKGNIGKFRGPGRKDDECPIATLNVLKLLSLTEPDEYVEAKRRAIRTLTALWNERTARKAYLFGMGTDFRKLKYPLIWYDILNVVDSLSRFREAVETREFAEMLAIVRAKEKNGAYVPESAYQYWKAFDFGQKKDGSDHIRKTVLEIEDRIRRE